MKNSFTSIQIFAALMATAAAGIGCSDDGPAPNPPERGGGADTTRNAVATGWSSSWTGDSAGKTIGGAEADASHIYTVTNRTELIKAVYPDAVMADDGTYTSEAGADPTPKIIYVKGRISLNTNAAGRELTVADYACEGYDFEEFKRQYQPREWNQLLDDDAPRDIPVCPGSQEDLRICSARRQRAVVELRIGSNTSLLGLGSDAKIVHGGVVVGGTGPVARPANPNPAPAPISEALAELCGIEPTPPAEPAPATTPAPTELLPVAENVIIRNITFEDAYDMFPAWDPGDSFGTPPETPNPDGLYPKCQLAMDPATGNGPHECPGGRWNSEYDNLRVQNSTHVWIDHCEFNDGDRESQSATSVWQAPYDGHSSRLETHDGALDINGYSDFVTVSSNVFRNHDKVMLIGGSDTVRANNGWGALSVTVNNNMFIGCGQRLPRVRFGKVHVYSNYVEGELSPSISTREDMNKPLPKNPLGSGIAVGHLAKVYSENNVFSIKAYPGDSDPNEEDVVSVAHRATPTEGTTPDVNEQTYFFDAGTMLNGKATKLMDTAQARSESGNRPALLATDTVWKPADSYRYTVTAAGNVKATLMATAGVGKLTFSGK